MKPSQKRQKRLAACLASFCAFSQTGGRRPNGFLRLYLNDRTILFLVILLDKTVSVDLDGLWIRTLAYGSWQWLNRRQTQIHRRQMCCWRLQGCSINKPLLLGMKSNILFKRIKFSCRFRHIFGQPCRYSIKFVTDMRQAGVCHLGISTLVVFCLCILHASSWELLFSCERRHLLREVAAKTCGPFYQGRSKQGWKGWGK